MPLALVAGFTGLAPLCSDLGPGETMATRVRDILILHGVAGLLIGVGQPSGRWIAALAGWGDVSMGLLSLAGNLTGPLRTLGAWAVALGAAAAGGYGGAWIRRRRARANGQAPASANSMTHPKSCAVRGVVEEQRHPLPQPQVPPTFHSNALWVAA